MKLTREEEDIFLRNIFLKSPGYLDLEDPEILAIDSKTLEPLNAKQLMQRDEEKE